MNCKVCGTRLGILERWRYGDFCSEEHKTDFARELEDLDRKVAAESPAAPERRPQPVRPRPVKSGSDEELLAQHLLMAPAPARQELEPEPEPEPPMADFLPQPCPPPFKLGKPGKPEKKAPPEKADKAGEVWRLLSRLAEQDALPAGCRPPAGRQDRPPILLQAPEETIQALSGYFMRAAYASMPPHVQMVLAANGLPYGNVSPNPAGFWGPGFALPMPLVTAQPRHWVDEQGWHWIADTSAHAIPSVEQVLSAYPMTAPWAQWPMSAPSAVGGRSASGWPAAPGGMPMQGPAGQPPQGAVSPAAHGLDQATGFSMMGALNPGQALGVPTGLGSRLFPSAGRGGVSPGSANASGSAAPQGTPAGRPAAMPPPSPGIAGGLFGGGQMVGWGMPQSGAPGAGPQNIPGYVWRELPPPFFSALVDLSAGVTAVSSPSRTLAPDPVSLVWPPAGPECPVLTIRFLTALRFAAPSQLPANAAAWPIPGTADYTAGPAWPDVPPRLPTSPRLPNPRVPRRVAPPVILPLGVRLGLPKPAEPLMAAGGGMLVSRGA